MWWSAWSRHQTLMPVVPSRRRCPKHFEAADCFGVFPPLGAPRLPKPPTRVSYLRFVRMWQLESQTDGYGSQYKSEQK